MAKKRPRKFSHLVTNFVANSVFFLLQTCGALKVRIVELHKGMVWWGMRAVKSGSAEVASRRTTGNPWSAVLSTFGVWFLVWFRSSRSWSAGLSGQCSVFCSTLPIHCHLHHDCLRHPFVAEQSQRCCIFKASPIRIHYSHTMLTVFYRL